ncbi:DUF6053 domain-containing protein [Lysobacter sp. CA199]
MDQPGVSKSVGPEGPPTRALRL